jgi:hypothetical protein
LYKTARSEYQTEVKTAIGIYRLARSARSERGKRGPAPGVSAGILIRGLAQVFAAQGNRRREAWHIFMHPPFACDSLQPHRHAVGTARRSISGVLAAEFITKVNANPNVGAQRRKKGADAAKVILPSMKALLRRPSKKPMGRPAK